jgi:ribosomal protein S18 acetylase RimI-like enzyme
MDHWDIRRAASVGEVAAAAYLFDRPMREGWTERFLAAPGHVMLLAYTGGESDGVPVGFVTGIEMTHPDKGSELCLYELEVAEPHRRRGVGRALTDALVGLAHSRGCYGVWVGADTDNTAALATYTAAGAHDEGHSTILTWTFPPPSG